MQTNYKLTHSLFIFGLMILFFIAAFPLVQAQTAAPGDFGHDLWQRRQGYY